jgi:sialate O-acetylesterase
LKIENGSLTCKQPKCPTDVCIAAMEAPPGRKKREILLRRFAPPAPSGEPCAVASEAMFFDIIETSTSGTPMKKTCLLLALFAQVLLAQESPFRLAPLFGDGMVLQQKKSVPIWGKGIPGSSIVVRTSWKRESSTRVEPDGSWKLAISTPSAGGPYELTIRHDDMEVTLKNVLVGEVWLCSGQSNMEMPLAGWPPDTILNAAEEISHSLYPAIRLFKTRRAYSANPEATCTGQWVECSPATSPGFSAAAYFFGRNLHEALHVPVGLILSSWGGTPVESWTSREFLATVPGFDSTLQLIGATAKAEVGLLSWLRQFPVVDMSTRTPKWEGLNLGDEECAGLIDDSTWSSMTLPTLWERASLGEFDGVVWFRKEITVPASWVHRDCVLELGPIDDMDVAYVNGRKVGGHEKEGEWRAERIYAVPGSLIDTTVLRIAVRVIDQGGGGGICGGPGSMSLRPAGEDGRLPLSGEWKFLPVAEYRGENLFVYGSKGTPFVSRPKLPMNFSAGSPTALYNGMIAPFVPFALAGVIWYQGESNARNPVQYRELFPLMIENWRRAFNTPGLPFYYAQIAPFDYGTETRSEFLREAQLRTLALKNTGMAVTLDIGNVKNIHPANKQEVGRRLALWALKNYRKDVVFSGPQYRSSKSYADRMELSFDHAGKDLVLVGREEGSGFVVAGEDRVFRPACVRVSGSTLVVSHPDIRNPQAVRYAFTNTSQATLFNTAGLPCSSFRTDEWGR